MKKVVIPFPNFKILKLVEDKARTKVTPFMTEGFLSEKWSTTSVQTAKNKTLVVEVVKRNYAELLKKSKLYTYTILVTGLLGVSQSYLGMIYSTLTSILNSRQLFPSHRPEKISQIRRTINPLHWEQIINYWLSWYLYSNSPITNLQTGVKKKRKTVNVKVYDTTWSLT